MELSLAAFPRRALLASRSDGARPWCPYLSGAYLYSPSSFFGPEFLASFLGSTAKRDQSFIRTYPGFREGLHGSLSLGNPPALKQSLRCIGRQACVAQAGYSKDRRELA